MRPRKQRGAAWGIALVLPVLLLLWGGGLRGAALIGAGLAVPREGLSVLFGKEEQTTAAEAPAQESEEESSAQESGIVQTTTAAKDKPAETELAVSAKIPDLKATPADIAALAAKAQASARGERLGEVRQGDFSKSGATVSYGAVLVKNTTESQSLDIKAELAKELDLSVPDKSKPAVLIFHTHTTESYMLFDKDYFTAEDSGRSSDPAQNMVRIGEELAARLELAGYKVLHDKTIHDTTYNGSYSRSAATVRKYLEKHPEIQVILDIHRDAIRSEKLREKPTAQIDGKNAAQLMIVTGAQEGDISYYPNWRGNLRFALQLQKTLAEKYPGLVRPLFFCHRVYNMDLGKNNLLIEVGSDSNTLEEAAYSARLLASALADLLSLHDGRL
jgi:stage II sporulation protein P